MRNLCVAVVLFCSCLLLAAEVPTAGDVVVSQASGSLRTEFTVITAGGYISFSVPSDWHVIAMQSKPPVGVAAFTVANAADEQTPDSTNAVISLIQPDTEQGKQALSKIGRPCEGEVRHSSENGWDLYAQDAHQQKTLYTILDARKNAGDVVVSVRIAWPHLVKNTAHYDEEMKAIFASLLESVSGAKGPYLVKAGDVLRRPANQ